MAADWREETIYVVDNTVDPEIKRESERNMADDNFQLPYHELEVYTARSASESKQEGQPLA